MNKLYVVEFKHMKLKLKLKQPDLERSDKDSFQGTMRRYQKCVDPQGSTFTDEQYV